MTDFKQLMDKPIGELGDELVKELEALRHRTVDCGESTNEIDEILADAKEANGNPVKLGRLMEKIRTIAEESSS